MGAVAADVKIDQGLLGRLRSSFKGELVRPSDPSYEQHRRIWNGSIDRRPALIARCTSVADVVAAVRFAREADLVAAIRSGGHSFPGFSTCDGGLVIDLSQLKAIAVDVAKRTARVQAGVLLGELDQATQPFGLAVPAGIVTHTGLAGLTLGGGIGWLMRKYGLTVDQLLGVEVVTADGRILRADATENADLFWGMRGAGSNFGIVTEFEFALNPAGPTVLAGPIFWPMDRSAEVLRFYRDWIADAPDELTTMVVHRHVPPLPAIPPEFYGRPVVTVIPCWIGPLEEGEKFIRPMREFGSPMLDLCTPKPFLALQSMFDPSFPAGQWYYFRSANLATLTNEVIDVIADRAQRMTSKLTAFPIFHLGGAIRRVPEDETPFSGRGAGHTININATTATEAGFAEEREWSRSFWNALLPYQTDVYVNFLMEEGEERIKQAYGADRYAKLKGLKRKYDPSNFFRLNQNIRPD
jgi:FAD/FMN-containing dehydrogenase